ncbi:hypothetical protein Avbf_19014 [Armadillidium vulgare]|nr:hypothetical protein Avbf_19014 [Armadillidium vulgare]
MELRIDLEDYEGNIRWAKYSYFHISDESSKFSTHDQDNDESDENCASKYKGGWWYRQCHESNLNGLPHKGNHSSYADWIVWKPFRGYLIHSKNPN